MALTIADAYLVNSHARNLASSRQHGLTSAVRGSTSNENIAFQTCAGDAIHVLRLSENVVTASIKLEEAALNTPAIELENGASDGRVRLILCPAKNELWFWQTSVDKNGLLSDAHISTETHALESPALALCSLLAPNAFAFVNAKGQFFVAALNGTIAVQGTLQIPAFSANQLVRLQRITIASKIYVLILATSPNPVEAERTSKKKQQSVLKQGQKSVLQFIDVTNPGRPLIAATSFDLEGLDEMVDLCVTPSNHLCCLSSNGSLRIFQVDAACELHLRKTLHLNSKRYRFPQSLPPQPAALVALSDSYVALLLQNPAAPEQMVVTVWDARHHICCVQSTLKLATSHQKLSLSWMPSALFVTQSTNKDERTYALPMSIPSRSRLDLALGKEMVTAEHLEALSKRDQEARLQQAEADRQHAQAVLVADASKRQLNDQLALLRNTLLEEISNLCTESTAMQVDVTRPQDTLDGLFERFIDQSVDLLQPFKESTTAKKTSKSKNKKAGFKLQRKAHMNPPLSAELIEVVVNAALNESRISTSAKTFAYLLDRQAVSDSMCEVGVARKLHTLGQSVLLQKALENVFDISEDDLVFFLRHALDDRERTNMFASVLSAIILYPTSPKPLRQALAKQISISDVKLICKQLADWVEYWNDPVVQLSGAPDLRAISNFTSVLIDTYFIGLLQDQSCHLELVRLTTSLQDSKRIAQDMSLLSGPLKVLQYQSERASKGSTGKRIKEDEVIGDYVIETICI